MSAAVQGGKLDETRRAHAVRIGFSLYWAYTWATDGGFAWESGEQSGWSATRHGAVGDASLMLRVSEVA